MAAGYATGHGDTYLDMLRELEAQVPAPICARAFCGLVPADFGTCRMLGNAIGEVGTCPCNVPSAPC